MQKKIITNSYKETEILGGILAKETKRTEKLNSALVINLRGDLGSGKTTFLQGFARGLGLREKITSPTFVIMKKFKIKNSKFDFFYHFDCYRITDPEEVIGLGFREILPNPKNIIAIEWGDSVKKILPRDTLIIDFKIILFEKNRNKREISFFQ